MKKYKCRKEIHAYPVTINDFWHIPSLPVEEGYAFIEEEGEDEQWMNKECFEMDHVLVDTWKDRLIVERDELEVKVNKLRNFVNSKTFDHVSEKQKVLLMEQLHHMQCYLDILNDRLEVKGK